MSRLTELAKEIPEIDRVNNLAKRTRRARAQQIAQGRALRRAPLPSIRIGMVAGITGLLCCVGPTALALLGVVSAGTAFAWATDLYGGYAWAFRVGGLIVLSSLAAWALKRRNQCTLGGVRKNWQGLALALVVAVATYLVLYAATTWLGTFA